MGQLVRQKIPTFFNGVSRQPASVRLSGQVDSADNVTFSVVTGGFSKRAGFERVGELLAEPLKSPSVYSYRRDADEAYFIAVDGGQLFVWNKAGQRQKVSASTASLGYLSSATSPDDITFATLADSTLVLNKKVSASMDKDNLSAIPAYNYAVMQMLEFVIKARYYVQIDYARKGDPSNTGSIRLEGRPLDEDNTYVAGDGASGFTRCVRSAIGNYDAPREFYYSRSGNRNRLTNWTASNDGSFMFIRAAAEDGQPYDTFTITTSDQRGGGTMKTVAEYATNAEDLSSKAWGGMVTRIGGVNSREGNQYFQFTLVPDDGTRFPERQVSYTADGETQRFDIPFDYPSNDDISVTLNGSNTSYAVTGDNQVFFYSPPASGSEIVIRYQYDGDAPAFGDGFWKETVKPGIPQSFDPATMPHILIRQADGSFEFGPADGRIKGSSDAPIEWSQRESGDTVSVPDPDFIGKQITGIGFHRSRVYFLADEYVYFSQTDDYFNFWPGSAAQVIDSDPFSRTAGFQQVQALRQAYPFRKALVVSSESSQFEVSSSQSLTPDSAVIDASTAYVIEPKCTPVAIGSELYFATRNGAAADVLEYSYDDSSLSNTAERIAIHVADYIPSPIVEMAADSTTGTLFARSESDPSSLYVYRLHWQGRKKVQSAWGRWTAGGSIQSVQVFDGHVWIFRLIGQRTYLERAPLNDNADIDGLPYPARLDGWMSAKGSYDPTTGMTQWHVGDSGFTAPVGVLGEGFSDHMVGRRLDVKLSSSGEFVESRGDFSDGELFIGERFESFVRLSPQYLRDQSDSVQTAGRLQLRSITFHYVETGAFDIKVTPEKRRSRIKTVSTAGEGTPGYRLDKPPIPNDGSVTARVRSRGETTAIEVVSDSETPFTVTSADWLGFYNDIARQQ